METFHGFIETTQDALALFEACRIGVLHPVNQRLTDAQKADIQSGSCFIFCERTSGIKRWTDGRLWGPSRILGHFLVYRQLEQKIPQPRHEKYDKSNRKVIEINGKKATVGSKGTCVVLEDGLIKKTVAATINGEKFHLVSYYTKIDIEFRRLETPRAIPDLARLTPDLTAICLAQSYGAKRRKAPGSAEDESLSASDSEETDPVASLGTVAAASNRGLGNRGNSNSDGSINSNGAAFEGSHSHQSQASPNGPLHNVSTSSSSSSGSRVSKAMADASRRRTRTRTSSDSMDLVARQGVQTSSLSTSATAASSLATSMSAQFAAGSGNGRSNSTTTHPGFASYGSSLPSSNLHGLHIPPNNNRSNGSNSMPFTFSSSATALPMMVPGVNQQQQQQQAGSMIGSFNSNTAELSSSLGMSFSVGTPYMQNALSVPISLNPLTVGRARSSSINSVSSIGSPYSTSMDMGGMMSGHPDNAMSPFGVVAGPFSATIPEGLVFGDPVSATSPSSSALAAAAAVAAAAASSVRSIPSKQRQQQQEFDRRYRTMRHTGAWARRRCCLEMDSQAAVLAWHPPTCRLRHPCPRP
ncbi:Gti1/Pac2 family-domain-containing protein [Entophlyctis helioformis]|nr:Gti1/Pac2 family-domain-containing protein [Entophlyctis helioformis]